jgi:hypothetical protein
MIDASIPRQQLKDFFGNLGYRLKLLEEVRAQTDVFLSTRFNVFDYIEPDENRLSDVIAGLLDPKETHAQGDRFLRAFLNMVCGLNEGLSGGCLVLREDLTSFIQSNRRRMDILLVFDDFAVAIENKPWAGEQADQIADYVDHLRRRFVDNFIIVFLSPEGSEPESLKPGDKERIRKHRQLVCVGYNGVYRHWLEACVKECCSEKIMWFLRDFIGFVEHEFGSALGTA